MEEERLAVAVVMSLARDQGGSEQHNSCESGER